MTDLGHPFARDYETLINSLKQSIKDRAPELNDFNEGSVISTLVHVLSRELKFLYEAMDQAYRRAFIDEASGPALEYVVALLDIRRNEPVKATGAVTFARKTPTSNSVAIKAGTRVTDTRGRIFETTARVEIPANQPDVKVAVQAKAPGSEGNVAANTITIMPTPPIGVNTVTNGLPLTGGKDEEPDEQLRERAKHALETSGRATLNAIKFAVLDVDKVEGVEVADRSMDDSIPLGEVRVRFSGGDVDKVREAVEQTRAAGIFARLETITEVLISGAFYVIPDKSFTEIARTDFNAAVVAALEKLKIGEPLSVRRLNAFAYDIPGLAEVAEAKLKSSKEPSGEIQETYFPARTELLRPDKAHLAVRRLDKLKATPQGSQITIELIDETSAPVTFNQFSLALSATLYAPFKTTPEVKERVGSLIRAVEFKKSDKAVLTITKQDVELDDEHDPTNIEVSLHAAAYPGLAEANKVTINLPV